MNSRKNSLLLILRNILSNKRKKQKLNTLLHSI